MQKTVLNETHHRLGAKMVDFGGWEMPLHYGSQLEEHHAVRRDCGMFDVSHMCAVDIAGIDAKTFLRRLLANNIDKLQQPGKAFYSVMLNEQGGVLDDLVVYYIDDTHYRVVVNAATAEKDIAWFVARRDEWGMDVEIQPRRDLAMIAVQGPNARKSVWAIAPETHAASAVMGHFCSTQAGDFFVARTGYTGEDGFEITLPAERAPTFWQDLLEQGAVPCGLGARDTLRLEAGMNLYGQDMDETTTPLDVGLGWTVDLASPRDFVGKEALMLGQHGQLLGVVLVDRGVLRAQQKVITPKGEGMITSGTFSPTMQKSIGFARLPLGVTFGNTVRVEIRDRQLAAIIVRTPFVRFGKVLVNF